MMMTTLHIVPKVEDEKVIYMELKTNLEADDCALFVTESEQSGTVSISAGSSVIESEFLSQHYRYAVGRTPENLAMFDADYYLNTIIPECATYLGCEKIQLQAT